MKGLLNVLGAMQTFVRTSVPLGAHALDARWYVSDEVFDTELDRVFRRSWICVGRAEQIPNTGDFITYEIAGESLIVVRDGAGSIHAFFNVCRHRGTRICTEASGNFKGSMQCPYHAWTYGLDGALIAARNMDSVEGFDRADYPLRQATLETFEGFLFINLAAHPEPFQTVFAPLIGRFAKWTIAQLKSARRIHYEVACNWKLVFQNYSECYHCPLIHPQLDKLSPSDSGFNDLTDGPFLGGYSTLRSPGGSLTTTGRLQRKPVGTVGGEELGRVYYYTIFPSLLLSLHPDYVMVHYVRPKSARRTEIDCEWLFDPAAMVEPGFDPSDAVEFWDLTNRQDWRVNELTQLGIASRSYTPGPYAQQEGLLHAFDRHYLRLMAR